MRTLCGVMACYIGVHISGNSQLTHTQLAILWASEGVEVALAVHNHAELSPTSHFHQGLAIVLHLKYKKVHL